MRHESLTSSIIGVNVITETQTSEQTGIRPVNLRTDLGPLADLIEIAFQKTLDDNGRAAIREMRYMSRMGAGLNVLGRLNQMTVGISLGYVYMVDGQLVGNASIYPANYPDDMRPAWIIANVATHPAYQRRGIARRLMQASLQMIAKKGGDAILQVDYDNTAAIKLYESMDFVKERAFTTWWRSALASAPPHADQHDLYITHPRRKDWQSEYQLAHELRPNRRGGIAWLQPVHPRLFNPTLWQRIGQWFSMTGTERLIVRDDATRAIDATLWIETGLALTRTRLTLMARPQAFYPTAEALLSTALRRFRTTAFVIDHPHDDLQADALLRRYRFYPHRTVWHMRWHGA